MGWYTVTKTIKGGRYVYLQRTWREGRHVRTQNHYVGPASDGGGGGFGRSYVGFHGSREGIPTGASPESSAQGTYGPGFYVTTSKRRADLHARDPAKHTADFDRTGGHVGEPTFDGTVDAFDLSDLNILFVKDGDTYIDLVDAVGSDGEPKGYPLPADKVALQELLEARGYDGIEVNDPDRMEIVIFPSAVERLRRVTTTDDLDRSPSEGSEEAGVPAPRAKPRGDVYTRITERIIADLERGVRPWQKPWGSGKPVSRPLRHNGEPYHGANVIMLWLTAEDRGYASPYWLTFRQAKELGGSVRRGQKGTTIAYVSTYTRTEEDDEGEETEREVLVRKSYTVFNADQIDGLPEEYHPAPAEPLDPSLRIQQADQFFEATAADIRHGGSRAFYRPSEDFVQMPPFEHFHDAESHAATLGHELIHWTSHPSRLDRDFGRQRWGDAGYAMEELVAEIGAAFLCTDLGITPEIRDDHAQYVAAWLKVLKNDKSAIFTAASHAEKAVGHLHELQADQGPGSNTTHLLSKRVPRAYAPLEFAGVSERSPLGRHFAQPAADINQPSDRLVQKRGERRCVGYGHVSSLSLRRACF